MEQKGNCKWSKKLWQSRTAKGWAFWNCSSCPGHKRDPTARAGAAPGGSSGQWGRVPAPELFLEPGGVWPDPGVLAPSVAVGRAAPL